MDGHSNTFHILQEAQDEKKMFLMPLFEWWL